MPDEKKTERKNLTITHVEEIKKVGDKQIPKLPFKAKDGDTELVYFTFRSSLFEAIKVGQTINADVETSTRVWDGQTYTDRRVVQVYIDGQPIGGKGQQGYRGKSPEELELSARAYALSYSKDLVVGEKLPIQEILGLAETFYIWLKAKAPEPKLETEKPAPSKAKTAAPSIGKVQDISELKRLMGKHRIETHEAYEILSIKSFSELAITPGEAWAKIREAKKIE